jgi:hypothetical protein
MRIIPSGWDPLGEKGTEVSRKRYMRQMHVRPDVRRDRVVTAHLRTSVAAAVTLY